MSFFKSQLFKNLQDGKLPEMEVNTAVSLDNKAIINLTLGLFIAGFLIVLSWKAFRRA